MIVVVELVWLDKSEPETLSAGAVHRRCAWRIVTNRPPDPNIYWLRGLSLPRHTFDNSMGSALYHNSSIRIAGTEHGVGVVGIVR